MCAEENSNIAMYGLKTGEKLNDVRRKIMGR